MLSITGARDAFLRNVIKIIEIGSKEKIICPCCLHQTQVYQRNINTGMALTLATMYKVAGFEPVHVLNMLTERKELCADFPKLRYWGVIEEVYSDRERASKRAGYWKVSDKGHRFLYHHIKLIKYKHILNDEIVKQSGDHVSFAQCLPEKFNYNELMSREGI